MKNPFDPSRASRQDSFRVVLRLAISRSVAAMRCNFSHCRRATYFSRRRFWVRPTDPARVLRREVPQALELVTRSGLRWSSGRRPRNFLPSQRLTAVGRGRFIVNDLQSVETNAGHRKKIGRPVRRSSSCRLPAESGPRTGPGLAQDWLEAGPTWFPSWAAMISHGQRRA
jgi:hypothetical protein